MKIHSTIKIDSVKETILPLLEKKYIKSVTDNKDGNLKSAVKVSSKVNTKKS